MKITLTFLLINLIWLFSGCVSPTNDPEFIKEYLATDSVSVKTEFRFCDIENSNIPIFSVSQSDLFQDSVSDGNSLNSNFVEREYPIESDTFNDISHILDTVNFTEVNETVYAISSVNIRELPTKESVKISSLSKGDQVTRTGVGDNGWSRISYDGATLYVHSDYLSKEKPIQIQNPYIGTVVFKNGSVEDKYVAAVANKLALLPNSVMTLLINNKATIYVTDENLAKTHFDGIYSSVQGVTIYDSNTILIEDRNTACNEATIHECGHLLDKYLGFISFSDEFVNIYELEKESLSTFAGSYGASSKTEYFAEIFRYYIEDKNKLLQYCPNSYAFIDECVCNL